jgi:4-amino-4-deoxy-L-arabinose transferase-like glycosyltransferase
LFIHHAHQYNHSVQRRGKVLFASGIAVLALLARFIPGERTIDDAFITFRYAQNLLSGHGLVYNLGERVLGTTTPLYAFLMAGLGALAGGVDAPFPALALLVNSLADAGTCLLLIALGRELDRPRAGWAAAAVWAIAPWSVTFAIGGMETSLLVLLATGCFLAHLRRRRLLLAGLGALAVLTRPDAFLFLLPLGLEEARLALTRRQVRSTLGAAVVFLIPLVLWAAPAAVWYGSPLPHSVAAKAVAYNLPRQAAFVRLLQHYATPFLEQETLGTPGIVVGFLLYPLLFLLGAVSLVRRRTSSWALAAYPLLYFAAYAAANPLLFRWYLTPPLPMLFLVIFAGIDRLATDVRRPWILTAAACLAVASTLLGGWSLHPDHGPRRPAPAMAYIRLEQLYTRVGEGLRPRLAPGDRIAAGDIGALGYITRARILDTVGLISPESTRFYPLPEDDYVINYAIPAELILEQQPDWVVILEVYGRETLLKDRAFLDAYRLDQTIPTDIYGSRGMLVFQRIEAP